MHKDISFRIFNSALRIIVVVLVILSPSSPVILNEVKNLLFVLRVKYAYIQNTMLRINSAKNLLYTERWKKNP